MLLTILIIIGIIWLVVIAKDDGPTVTYYDPAEEEHKKRIAEEFEKAAIWELMFHEHK